MDLILSSNIANICIGSLVPEEKGMMAIYMCNKYATVSDMCKHFAVSVIYSSNYYLKSYEVIIASTINAQRI